LVVVLQNKIKKSIAARFFCGHILSLPQKLSHITNKYYEFACSAFLFINILIDAILRKAKKFRLSTNKDCSITCRIVFVVRKQQLYKVARDSVKFFLEHQQT